MWKVTIEDDQANTTVVHLIRDEYSIGRAEENTIRLTERNISRRHARVVKSADHWMLVDLKSYNGCFVNGQRVSGQMELAHGDLIQLGDYRLEIVDETLVDSTHSDKAITSPAAPRSQALLGQPDRLVMLLGPSVGSEFPLSQSEAVLIGRGEECQISINHPSVSRVHALVQPLGDGRYEIVDRESANGVRVNGVDLPHGILDARDVVELGDVVLKFIRAGEIYVPGSDESVRPDAMTFGGSTAEAQPSKAPAASGLKITAIGAVAVVLVVLGMALVSRPQQTALDARPTAAPIDSAQRTLRRALALMRAGDIEGAHRLVSELAPDSNARKTPEYRQIEAAWADALFQKAQAATDPALKRVLLDKIARSPSVDSMRRKRAANELLAVDSMSVDVSDLPRARPIKRVTPLASADAGESAPAASVRPAPVRPRPPPHKSKNPYD